MELLTAIAIGLLFAIGLFQMLRRNLIRSVIGFLILTNAVNLFLLSTGAYHAALPAYVGNVVEKTADAVPQALILTAIVISMGAMAFILAMLYVIVSRYKTGDMDELKGLKN